MGFAFVSLNGVGINATFDGDCARGVSFSGGAAVSFNAIRPLLYRCLFPHSSIGLGCHRLIHLTPVPAPSFTHLFIGGCIHFIGVTSIIPCRRTLLTKGPFFTSGHSFVPHGLPFAYDHILRCFLLRRSVCAVCNMGDSGSFSHLRGVTTAGRRCSLVLSLFCTCLNFNDGPVSCVELPTSSSSIRFPSLNPISFFSTSCVIPMCGAVANSASPCNFVYFGCSGFTHGLHGRFINLNCNLRLRSGAPISFTPLLTFCGACFSAFNLAHIGSFRSASYCTLVHFVAGCRASFNLNVFAGISPGSGSPGHRDFFVSFVASLTSLCCASSGAFVTTRHRGPGGGACVPLNNDAFLRTGNSASGRVCNIASTSCRPRLGTNSVDGNSALFARLSLSLLGQIAHFITGSDTVNCHVSS